MRKVYNSIPIRFKLPIIIAGLSVISIIATSAVSFLNTRSALLADAESRMVSINRMQARFVEEFFTGIDRDLTLRANSHLVINAVQDFTAAFNAYPDPLEALQAIYITDNPHPNGEKDQLTNSGVGDEYDRVHTRYHPDFDALQDANGYYDVFLFDIEGNLIYSVFKELDFATNMIEGAWRNSGLATVFNGAMNAQPDGATTFDDFKPYEPSYGAPAAFFARPVFDDAGERIGVLAYQAPIDAINAAMRGVSGLGDTGEVVLVGADRLMRNDSPATDESDILMTSLDDAAVSRALEGQVGFAEITDGLGNRVWASYGPLELFGSRWAIVAKQSSAELRAPLESALWKTVQAAMVAITIALAVVVFVARGISRPLVGLNAAVQNIARRDFDALVPATGRRDEIGQIGQAIDAFRKDLKAAEESAVETAFKGAAFEVSGAPMMITNLDLEVLQINSALTRIMEDRKKDFELVVPGFDPQNLVGLSMKGFAAFPPDVELALKRPEHLPYKTKISVGEAYIGLLLDVVRDSAGNMIGYVLDWKDQTYQMQSQTLMQAIDGGQGRVEITKDRKVRAANDTFSGIVGIPLSEITGVSCSGVIEPMSEVDGHSDFWDHVAADNSIFDHFRVNLGAKEVILQGSLSPVKDHKGEIRGSILLGSDVTENYLESAAKAKREREMTEAQAKVVQTLQSSLSKLSNGDLRSRIEDHMPEEYEVLRHDFNAAIDGLNSALTRILEGANLIYSNANEVSSATVELSHRTESQAATLEKTAAALNDLSSLVSKATEGTSEVAKVVNSTRENAKQSGEIVREAVEAMQQIKASSEEISNIINVINEISFQTNLLALNAGVEAARAGDAGRGFAVVASEVRELAQRSSSAADDITKLISSSSDQVVRGVELVNKTGAALDKIVAEVVDISKQVDEIAASSVEQASGIGEINTAVSQINTTTQSNAAMVEESTAASQSLKHEASTLLESVSRFTISDAGTERRLENDTRERKVA